MDEPARITGFQVLRELAASAWRFRARVLGALALLLLAKLATVAVPLLLKAIIDALSSPDAYLALPVFLLLGYALMRFAATLFGEIRDAVFARVTQRTVADFTLRTFRHVHSLSARFHALRSTGALTREVERGTAGIAFLLGVALFTIVPTLVEIGTVLAIMVARYSAWFTLIIVLTFVLYVASTVLITHRRAIYQRAMNELDSTANGRLVDSLLNVETVKYYTNESLEVRRLGDIMDRWIDVGIRNQRALSLLHVTQSGIIAAGVASVMLLAGESVVNHTMTVGDLVLVNAYVIQVCLPLNSLGFVFREAGDALINVKKLFALLARRSEFPGSAAQPALTVSRGEVRFEHVDFGYEPARQVLWDIDFRIAPGQKVAVVGESGSGKSTIARLLFRFYDPASGRISIDAQDLRAVSPKSLRAAIGIVPQDTILFNDTVANNIAYGRADATLAEVIDAARAANVHDFISALPRAYETVVGERGVKLSGGERQRIAIARAVLKNPRIMVFDEATSALDTPTERTIQRELDRLAHDRSTLVIAHRLSTVVGADLILVLDHGRVIERGAHQELVAAGGLYAKMWALQEQESALRLAERRAAQQPVNLSSVIAAVLDALRSDIDARKVNLYTMIDADAGRISGDPSELQQLVWELLATAMRESPVGSRIEVRLSRDGAMARLLVADTGARRPSAARRGDRAESGTEGERLLDLALVRRIVDEHEGTLAIGPANDAGTSYVVALPLRAVATERAADARSAERPPALPSLSGRRVMIVDDQDAARDALSGVLEAQGARVDALPAGAPAVDILRRTARPQWPDALICDIALPDEDGYTVLRRIRALEAERKMPLAARLPAIALSGYTAPEDRMRALLAGFQMHLGKPVDPKELIASIASLIGLSGESARSPPLNG
jgi:ATP-binding cassette subfamily B protein